MADEAVRKTEKQMVGDYEAARAAGNTKGILAAHAALQAHYTRGAKPCPKCSTPPHGMHPGVGRFVVGCLGCTTQANRVESVGETIEDAVAAWNAGEYVPPKDPGAPPEVTHAEAPTKPAQP